MEIADHLINAVLADFTASSKMSEPVRGTLDIISPLRGLVTFRNSPVKVTF